MAISDGAQPLIRASDPERDAVMCRLQDAFAAGRLGEAEFGERMQAALQAGTRGELAHLLADLPEAAVRRTPPGAALPRPGRLAVAVGNTICRGGRWRVPRRFTAIAYKGASVLDLRAADFSRPMTTITAIAYKSRISIVVPPIARVEARGLGVTTRGCPGGDSMPLPADAPVIQVRGYAVLGTVEAVYSLVAAGGGPSCRPGDG